MHNCACTTNTAAGMEADKEKGGSCGFEGFEKRLEMEFEGNYMGSSHRNCQMDRQSMDGGLRLMSRSELDEMLSAAGCTIVSEQHNLWFDAYVLSESSLFVYPYQLVLKTCGRTQLLSAVPILLRHAATLSLNPIRCKYSRGTFIFPHAQPYPYRSFSQETHILDQLFGDMVHDGGNKSAHVLDGHAGSGNGSWHIYTAIAPLNRLRAESTPCCGMSTVGTSHPTYTVEMCMTHLHASSACHFFNPLGTKLGCDMTQQSGISSLLPNALISDFAFTPCGYSMNGMEEAALSTIHITPEESHSYASFEVMGYDPSSLNLHAVINRAVSCFKPGSLAMSIHVQGGDGKDMNIMAGTSNSWDTSCVVPHGYVCNSSVRQELAGQSIIAFHTFSRSESHEHCGVIPEPLLLLHQQVRSVIAGAHPYSDQVVDEDEELK